MSPSFIATKGGVPLWQDVKGHSKVVEWLGRTLAGGRVGHAYLFLGSKGIGKAKVAASFAQAIVGADNMWPHPDVTVIEARGQSVTIEQMRELTKQALLTPMLAKRKVYIVPRAESLTVQAANSLLQTLEEPTPAVVFILLANAPSVLPTIVSRCQVVRFGFLSLEDTMAVLTKELGAATDQALLLAAARLSLGRPGEAMRLLADEATILLGVGAWVRHYLLLSINDKIGYMAKLEKDQDRLYDYVYYLAVWIRDLLLYKLDLPGQMANLVCAELVQQATTHDTAFLLRKLQALHALLARWSPGINKRMVLDQLLLVSR